MEALRPVAGEVSIVVKWLIGLFLMAHGLAHFAVWLPPYKGEGPFNPSRSWLLKSVGMNDGSMRSLAIALAAVAGIGFELGGLGWLTVQSWGRLLSGVAAVASLVLIVLYFNLWLSFAILINAAILYQLAR